MKEESFEAVTFDFQKNLYAPNEMTNDVYYRRQHSCFSFNAHILSSKESHFYCCDKTVAKKGAEYVRLMLNHFYMNALSPNEKSCFFWDSCCGKTKIGR